MTVGEKVWTAIGGVAIAVVLFVFAFSVIKGHTAWQNNNDACIARGGQLVYVDGNYICGNVEYKVTPR